MRVFSAKSKNDTTVPGVRGGSPRRSEFPRELERVISVAGYGRCSERFEVDGFPCDRREHNVPGVAQSHLNGKVGKANMCSDRG